MKTVAIVGLGRIGTALAVTLERCGYPVQIVRRDQSVLRVSPVKGKEFIVTSLEKAVLEADVLFITTPDDIIAEIAVRIQKINTTCKAVLHVSGSLSSEILAPLKEKGIETGSLHPLQSFPNAEQAVKNFPGSYFTFEGDNTLLPWISELVEDLGGILKILPSTDMKTIYHAGAVFVSNYMVGIAELGIKCLVQAGFRPDEAREALLPLMKGTMNNLAALSPEKAITGPISRGDVGVVKSHLQSFEEGLTEIIPVYCELAEVLANLSLKSGKITKEKYYEIITTLKGGAGYGTSNSK